MSVVNNDNFSTLYDSIISKLCNVSLIEYQDNEIENSISFRVNSNIYSIPFNQEIDVEQEIIKINNDLDDFVCDEIENCEKSNDLKKDPLISYNKSKRNQCSNNHGRTKC